MQMDDINKSLELQQQIFDKQLILNPVENCPFQDILVPCSSYLHGLYNTDTVRNNQQKFQSKNSV